MRTRTIGSLGALKRALENAPGYFPEVEGSSTQTKLVFGHVLERNQLTLADGSVGDFMAIGRGGRDWATCLMITRHKDDKVVVCLEAKKGARAPQLELPAGGIPVDLDETDEEGLIRAVAEEALRETGYGDFHGSDYLGHTTIDTGLLYSVKKDGQRDRGVRAHMIILYGVRRIAEPCPSSTEQREIALVSPDILWQAWLDPTVPKETSADSIIGRAFATGILPAP